jgi:PAS domain S-box-containing protein
MGIQGMCAKRRAGLVIHNSDGGIVTVNAAFERMLGYAPGEMQGVNLQKLLLPEDQAALKGARDRALESGSEEFSVDVRFCRKDKTLVWVEGSFSVIREASGRPSQFIGLLNEKASHKIFQAIHQPSILIDPDRKVIDVNEAVTRISGKSKEELIGLPCYKIYHGETADAPIEGCPMCPILHGEIRQTVECEANVFGGNYLVSCTPVFDEEGTLEYVIHVATDISTQRELIQHLKDSENKLQTVFMSSPDSIVITSLEEGIYLDVNDTFLHLSGYTREEILGKSSFERGIWGSLEERAQCSQLFRRDGRIKDFEALYRSKNGDTGYVSISAETITLNGTVCVLAQLREITDRKKNEESIRMSEEKFSRLFHLSPDAITLTKLSDRLLIEANDSLCALTGYTREELLGESTVNGFFWEVPSELAHYQQLLKTQRKVDSFEAHIRTKPGEVKTALISSEIIPINGEWYVMGIIRDITARKQMEVDLRRAKEAAETNEQRLRMIYDTIGDVIFQLDVEGEGAYRFHSVNPEFTKLTGIEPSQVVGKLVSEVIPEPSLKVVLQKYREAIAGKRMVRWVEKSAYPAGELIGLVGVAPVFNESGQCIFLIGSVHDITSLKTKEKELMLAKEMAEEKERQLHLIVDNFVNGMLYQVATLNETERKFTFVSETVKDLYGYSPEEVLQNPHLLYDRLYGDDAQKLLEKENEAMRTMSVFKAEVRVVNPDGSLRWSYFISKPRMIEGILHWDGIEIDITEQKLIELELIEAKEKAELSEQRLNEAQQLAHMGNWELDLVTNKLRWSEEIYRMFEVDPDGFESTYEAFLGFIHPDDREMVNDAYAAHIETHKPYNITHRIVLKDGRMKYVQERCKSEYDATHKAIRSLGTVTDITEQITIEKELILAKEIAQRNEFQLKSQKLEIELNNERLESLLRIAQLPTVSIQELLDFALEEAIKLTNSKIGYIYFYNETTQQFILNTWSKDVMRECRVMDPQSVYDLDRTGCWGEVVRQRKPIVINDYQAENSVKKGIPGGHVPLYKFLSIPVLFENRIVAVAGVANKDWDYDNSDVRQLTLLMDNVWRISERLVLIDNLNAEKEKAVENELFLQKSQDIGNIGSYTIRFDKGVWQSSKTMDRIFGIDESFTRDVDGWLGIVYPDDRQRMSDYLANDVVLNRNKFTNEYRIVRPSDGEVRWVYGFGELTIDADGTVTEMIGTIQDITERKQIEQELIHAKEKAEESDRLKTAFLHNMSHEIRTPLNAIMGFSSLLPNHFQDPNRLSYLTDCIIQRGEDLLEIIDDVLDIARIESGQFALHMEAFSLSDLSREIRETVDGYRRRNKKEDIPLNLEGLCLDGVSKITTDRGKLRQVLLNLINNAFKFTDTGEIACGCEWRSPGELMFYVRDTGIGIPKEKHAEIFQRFVQVATDRTRFYAGTGLGLSIVKGILDLLGGKIWVNSEPGVGSTFYVTLPVEVSVPEVAPALTSSGKAFFGEKDLLNLSLLVVEDDPYNMEYITEILTELDCEKHFVTTGAEALQVATTHPVDVILMDIRLPDIMGYEVIRQIKAQRNDVYIIAQTAFASASDREKAFAAGCDDFISKPYRLESLLEKIQQARR